MDDDDDDAVYVLHVNPYVHATEYLELRLFLLTCMSELLRRERGSLRAVGHVGSVQ